MGLQADYDLKMSSCEIKAVIKRINHRKDLQTAKPRSSHIVNVDRIIKIGPKSEYVGRREAKCSHRSWPYSSGA